MDATEIEQFVNSSLHGLVAQEPHLFLLQSSGPRIEPNQIYIGAYQVRNMRHGFLHGSVQHKPREKDGVEDNETMGHPKRQIGYYVRGENRDGSTDWRVAIIGTSGSNVSYESGTVTKIEPPSPRATRLSTSSRRGPYPV